MTPFQHRTDRPVDIGPDGFELTAAFAGIVVIEVARELDERAANALNNITERDLLRGTSQDVTAVGASLAANDIDPLEYLHDLKEKLDGYVLAFGYVLNADGGIRGHS